jgi:hypothetical protein
MGSIRSASIIFVATTAFVALAACENEAEEKPPVVVPPKVSESPKWLDEAAARCALAASCAKEHDAPRFGDPAACVAAFGNKLARGEKDAVYNCLGGAKTCDAALSCIHDGQDPRAVRYCAAHSGVLSACDGDMLVSCNGDDATDSTSVSCAEMGAKCTESPLPGGLLVRACFSDKLCPKGTTGARCDGDKTVVSCHDGAVERVQCGAGTRCVAHADAPGENAADCEPTGGRHCTELDHNRCDGDNLVECVARGHGGNVRVTDCSASGLRCAGRGVRAGCYVPSGASCEPGPATCDGEALSFCADGQVMRVSCTHLGLGACSPAANGPNAACVVPKKG